MPFLENVTRGRGIPPERLDDVAEHYLHFGGVSPINGINRALIEQLRELELDLPVYFGNRNWEPYVEDTVAAMRDDGIRRAAVFTTSAWGGYSSCAQYVEDIARAAARGRRRRARTGQAAPVLRPSAARRDVRRRDRRRRRERRAATTRGWCSPRIRSRCGADRRCGPDLYAARSAYASALVAAAAGYADYDQVWQSRSGPPQVPWLEPDVADHLAALADTAPRR